MTTAPESINIHTDSPINDLREDKFGRASLVELLAKSIQTKCESEHDSLCIGIYGKWGEGKTSFVNMLKQKIKLDNPTLSKAIVDFNPWIINEEKGLIKDFFKTIAGNAEGKLKEFIAKYGGIIAYSAQIVGNVVAPGLGASFKKHVKELNKYILKASETSIEQQKEDISKELVGSKKHLIVFIDDIDRLDCDEIHAVFRLVRQVADFKNTIYVLSLDEERVAKSIGKYFGEGCESDGRQFLEKIVQVPIVLPNLQETKIKALLQDALEGVYDSCGLKEKDEIEDIVDRIHCLFETPREIIRYKNQLMFFFPTAHTEVNHSDYCILEAIKVRNLSAYNLIRINKPYILRDLPWSYENTTGETDHRKIIEKEYKELTRKVTELFSDSLKDGIIGIMKYFLSDPSGNNSEKSKRLSNPMYFNRYFLHTAPEFLISDRIADELDCTSRDILSDWIIGTKAEYGLGEVVRSLLSMVDRQNKSSSEIANICISISQHCEQTTEAILARDVVERLFSKLSDADFKIVVNTTFKSPILRYALFSLMAMPQELVKKIVLEDFNELKVRMLNPTSLRPFRLNGPMQRLFFRAWKLIDENDFTEYMLSVFNTAEFDTSEFIANHIKPENDSRGFLQFEQLFGSTLNALYDRVKEREEYTDTERVFVLNHHLSRNNNGIDVL